MSSLLDLSHVRHIPLTQGKMAIVDACDYEYLSQWKWCFWKSTTSKCGGYAARVDLSTGKRVKISMHRLVYSMRQGVLIESLKDIDHKNTNGLDNRFENLRHATRVQNSGNRGTNSTNTTGYKGVKQDFSRSNIWIAQIQFEGKKINLGYFNSPEEAALAYNEAALRLFGEFAYLNKVEGVNAFVKRSYKSSKDYQFKGVSFHKRQKKWEAYAKLPDRKRKHIGYFKTIEEAKQAYEEFISKMSNPSPAV